MKEPVQKLSTTGSELPWLPITRHLGTKGADHNPALLLQFPKSHPTMIALEWHCYNFYVVTSDHLQIIRGDLQPLCLGVNIIKQHLSQKRLLHGMRSAWKANREQTAWLMVAGCTGWDGLGGLMGQKKAHADGWLLLLTACQGWLASCSAASGWCSHHCGRPVRTNWCAGDRYSFSGRMGSTQHMHHPNIEYVPQTGKLVAS